MRIFYLVSIILTIVLTNVSCVASDDVGEQVFSLVKQKKWHQAHQVASLVKHNIALEKFIFSQQFLDVSYPQNSFETIIKFVLENPTWPQINLMRVNAENLINDQTNENILFEYFSINSPVTGKGHRYYAQVASKYLSASSPRLRNIIKLAWQRGIFSSAEQQIFAAKYTHILTLEDHIKKIDFNLLQAKITIARNCYAFVNSHYRKSFEVQIAIMQRKSDWLAQVKDIPKKYYTPGLVYYYLEAQKKMLIPSQEVRSLISIAQEDSTYADKIWKIQNYIVRNYIEQKKYDDAYKVASCHFAKSDANVSEAEFLSGWLALRYINQPKRALEHFATFDKVVNTPMSKSRGIYWLGRAHEALGHIEKAKELYRLAAVKYPYTFYGQVAHTELGMKNLSPINEFKLTTKTTAAKTNNNHLLEVAKLIMKFGTREMNRIYLQSIAKNIETKDVAPLISALKKSQNIHYMAWFAKHALQKHIVIKDYTYPTNPYKNKELPVELPLTLSIIRQESVFDQYAVSSAEARGLMQVLPSTACDVAKAIGDKCNVSQLTNDYSYNMRLGSHYLRQLIDSYNGSYVLAIAAYNAGSHNVDKWLALYGDPRLVKNYRATIDWLELVPFYETRNYIQRVLENLRVYRSILNHH